MSRSLVQLAAFLFVTVSIQAFPFIPLNQTDKNGCRIGQEFRDGSCKMCRPGSFRFLGPADIPAQDPFHCGGDDDFTEKIETSSNSCRACPAGTYNPFFGGQTASRCQPCPEGTTSGPGARHCKSCRKGTSSSPGTSKCVRCGKGYFITSSSCDSNAKACTKCPKGFYSGAPNAISCTACPPGTSTVGTGANGKAICQKCGRGGVKCSCRKGAEQWNAVASYRPIGHSVCTACPPGTRALTPFATKPEDCVPCPSGTSLVEQEGCKPCPDGEQSFGRGATYCRASRSDDCPFESFKDRTGVCKLCPGGYKMNTMTRQCELCPSGSVSQGFTETTCTTCKFPDVAPPNGDGFCSCGRNFFKDFDTFECRPCPKGMKLDSEFHENAECELDCDNFPNQTGCKPCPADHGRDFETNTCVKCGSGLRSLVGEERCVNPQTGCPKGSVFGIQSTRYGYSLTCYNN